MRIPLSMRRIFESPLPQVDGESRLSDCPQVWDLRRFWNLEPGQGLTGRMCKNTVPYLVSTLGIFSNESTLIAVNSLAALKNLVKTITKTAQLHFGKPLVTLEKETQRRTLTRQCGSVGRKRKLEALPAFFRSKLRRFIGIETITEPLYLLPQLSISSEISAMVLGIEDVSYWLERTLHTQEKEDSVADIAQIPRNVPYNGNQVGLARCLGRIGEI